MKTLFFKKNILFLICFFVIFLAFAHSTSAARPNNKERTMRLKKVVVLDSKCVENNGKCIEESKAKDLVKVISTESLCSEGKVCVKNTTPAKTDLKPATKDSKAVIDEKKTPIVPAANDTSTIPKEVSEFCKTNPTRAQINDGTAKKNGFDGSAMSQEECQVWVYGSTDQYQSYVAKNDPEVNKEYEKILTDMKTTINAAPEKDPTLLANISKAIEDVNKTIVAQTKAVENNILGTLAPAQNKVANSNLDKYLITKPDASATGIESEEAYKQACKTNNGLSSDSDAFSTTYAKVVYSKDQVRCPAGYSETGLQYSIALKMHCCVKNDSYFNSCFNKGIVQYGEDCKTVRINTTYSGTNIWVCCTSKATTFINATPQIIDEGVGLTLLPAYEKLCNSKSGDRVDGKTCLTGFVPGVGYNKYFNASCCKRSP